MRIRLNGAEREIPDGSTVRTLLEHLDIRPERVAVEINEEIVRKPSYHEVRVHEGDRVEVVQFMGGGQQSGRGAAEQHGTGRTGAREPGGVAWKRSRS
jgi:thiamine biosynthesis protein ThiS